MHKTARFSRAKTIEEQFHSVKNNSSFEVAALLPSSFGWWKTVAIVKLEFISTEWSFYVHLRLYKLDDCLKY